MQSLLKSIGNAYARTARALGFLESPLLFAIRLYWGWQFAQDGWGKLTHLSRVAGFFSSLNLPAPATTALCVALVEFVGGILFAAGIASRLVSLVLFVNMTVAYLSVPDDRVNFSHILSNPSVEPERFIGSLMDGLTSQRVEVDMIKFSGPTICKMDNRLMALQLVQQWLTEAAMFTADGESIIPSELLWKKPVLLERGSFRPLTNPMLDMLERAQEMFCQPALARRSAGGDV